MHRRRLLASLAVAAGAGCLGRSGGDQLSPAGARTDTTPQVPTASDTFAGISCPEYPDADRTVCYHTSTGDTDAVLTADPEVFDPDDGDNTVETLRFTLRNRGEWTVLVNPHDWAIHRRDGSSWSRVAPAEPASEPLYSLEPGETLEWGLPERTHPSPGGDETYRVDTSLDPGTYAFSVTGRYDGTDLTETPSGEPPDRTAFVALFRLDTAVGRTGETRTVRTNTPG